MSNQDNATPGSSSAFNPYTQIFNITLSDGVTQIGVSLDDMNYVVGIYYSQSISYGVQFGLCGGIFLALVTFSLPERMRKVSVRLQAAALLVNMFRTLLLALYYPSNFTELYDLASGEYLKVNNLDFFIVVYVLYSQAALRIEPVSTHTGRLFFVSNVFFAANIFWFAGLFNVKLIMHLAKNKRFLPSRNKFTPIEVLVVTNGLMMVIPTIFASLQLTRMAFRFEVVPWMMTSIICVLSYGSLVAQRISNSPIQSFANIGSPSGSNGNRNNRSLSLNNHGLISTNGEPMASGSRNLENKSHAGRAHMVRAGTSCSLSPTKMDIEARAVLVERDLDQQSEKRMASGREEV
ncbi:Fungal pheromone mating factor STE2 GPCR [Ceratocystis platani]|uniref:Fungal pheromone mating factor STE2 GPCR n=1 Tax=Ceratocystis fimbriata f. sp. platani TaxID=88771 RepID=A0A0F8B357_CERFI|nr:Fungal pheromone mating factor STE2 GPCR [Ceratocystis platani]